MIDPNTVYPELVEGLSFLVESSATLRQAQGCGLGYINQFNVIAF